MTYQHHHQHHHQNRKVDSFLNFIIIYQHVFEFLFLTSVTYFLFLTAVTYNFSS